MFPEGLIVLVGVPLALFAALFGLVRRGLVRVPGVVLAVAVVGASLALVLARSRVLTVLVALAVLLTLAAASAAFRVRVVLPRGPRPRRAVLFYNPRSGGGKAERFALASEARARGIEPVELARGDDLLHLRLAIPMHWGILLPGGPAGRHRARLGDPPRLFARHVARLAKSVAVRISGRGRKRSSEVVR